MVYEWIEKDNQNKQLFNYFLKELNDILIFNSETENKQIDIKAKLFSIEKIIKDLSRLFYNDITKLEQYQRTSIKEIDYISSIKDNINSLSNSLKEIKKNLDSPELLQKILLDISIFANDLEINIKAMEEQAKQSLAFLYNKGEDVLLVDEFINCTKKIGGKINYNHGNGEFFFVEFALFNHVMIINKINKNELSMETLNSFIEENKHRIEKIIEEKYLKCYYLKNNEEFRNIFIKKYKKFFELSFSKE